LHRPGAAVLHPRWRALAERHAADSHSAARLAARDLLHAAVVLRVAEGSAEGPGRIVSADGDFDELAESGLERHDPADVGSWRREVEGYPAPGHEPADPPDGGS
jgi:hypothetical protein